MPTHYTPENPADPIRAPCLLNPLSWYPGVGTEATPLSFPSPNSCTHPTLRPYLNPIPASPRSPERMTGK